MPYAIKYFRDATVVSWYREHGITDKPVGWVLGKTRHLDQMAALKEAAHINALGPSVPVVVQRVT